MVYRPFIEAIYGKFGDGGSYCFTHIVPQGIPAFRLSGNPSDPAHAFLTRQSTPQQSEAHLSFFRMGMPTVGIQFTHSLYPLVN